MTVRVRLFAVLRDLAGVGEGLVVLPEGATVEQAKEPLLRRFPPLRQHIDRCAYAINRAYAKLDAPLHDGDELALIPPVSGG